VTSRPTIRPQKFLFVALNYAPEYVGCGKYTSEWTRWLASRGHEVRVVCAPPYYPQWRVWPGFRAWNYQRAVEEGVDVIRCPLWVPRKPRALSRIFHLLSFALTSAMALLATRMRPDWVVVVAPTLAAVPASQLFAARVGAKTWLHVQDFERGAAVGVGLGGANVSRFTAGIERWLLSSMDHVSTISEPMLAQLRTMARADQCLHQLPNWVDIESIRSEHASSAAMRRDLGFADEVCFTLYAGSLNLKQNLEVVIDAARQLEAESQLRFVICGDGPELVRLQQRARGLRNLSWLAPRSDPEFAALMAAADIHLLPQRSSVAEHVLPSKLGGMLASGRPVVATAHPGTALDRIVEGRGLVTPPADVAAFAEAIRSLARQPELRTALGRAGRRYVEETLAMDPILVNFETMLDDSCR